MRNMLHYIRDFSGNGLSVVYCVVSRKYTKDYRVEARLTKRGAVRDEAIYCGAYFKFSRPREAIRRCLRFHSAAELGIALSIIAPMCFPCAYCKQIYIVLPLVLSLLPVWFLFMALYRVQTAGEKVIREHRDKIANRFPTAALFQLIAAGLVLIGTVVFIIIGALQAVDWIFSALALLRAAAAVPIFLRRRDFAMEVVPEE